MPEQAPTPLIDLANVKSAVLRRLIAEIRQEKAPPNQHAYDRVYSRHNRS